MRPPVERTHDISQIDYHMKDLRAFGEDLTNAATGAFPKGKSRYNEVHVLLLSWEDDRLGVIKEINELRSVLDQVNSSGFSRHRASSLKSCKDLPLPYRRVENPEQTVSQFADQATD